MPLPREILTKNFLEQYKRYYLTIDCGEWSYGFPKLRMAQYDAPRTLKIGRYCSIGVSVEIFVGAEGRHYLDTLTTYPIAMAVTDELLLDDSARSKHPDLFEPPMNDLAVDLDVHIGHDVWIGAEAIIFAGVKIGTGAVIGTRALVTNDVPPFAIVGGVPAKVIRQRHEPAVAAAILASEWWRLEPDEVWRRCGTLVKSRRVLDVVSLLRDSGPQ